MMGRDKGSTLSRKKVVEVKASAASGHMIPFLYEARCGEPCINMDWYYLMDGNILFLPGADTERYLGGSCST